MFNLDLIGVLNSGIARSVGNPFAATAVMLALAAIAFGLTLPLYGPPTRPIDITKLVGLMVMVAGIAVMEIGNLAKARL